MMTPDILDRERERAGVLVGDIPKACAVRPATESGDLVFGNFYCWKACHLSNFT